MADNDVVERTGCGVLLIGLTGSFFVVVATFGFGHSVTPSWFALIFRALLVFIAVVLLAGYTIMRYVVPLRRSTKRRDVIALGLAQATELQRMAGTKSTSRTQAKIFTAAILTPASIRQRVTERYTPGQRTLRQSVQVEAQIPKHLFPHDQSTGAPMTDETIYFPVIIPVKGDMHDFFSLRSGSGEEVPVLSYSQYLQVVASVLRALLMNAFEKTNFAELPRQVQEAERRALLSIMERRGGRGARDTDVPLDYLTNLRPSHEPSLRMVVELVMKLSSSYALLAAVHCSADQRVILRYERTVIPEMKLAAFQRGQVLLWLKYRLRLLLGARPVDLTVRLENAWTCQSYHLMVDSAEGLFLANQQLPVDINEYFTGKKFVAGVPPYYRFRRRLGQTYAHFYARFFPEPRRGEAPPSIRFTYFEVPPGSIFRATVASMAGALLIWTVGYVLSRKEDVGTDAPALLLAFPAIAAAWLGFEAPSRRLLEATFAARMSLMVTASTSIVGSGLFMIYRSGLDQLDGRIPNYMTFLGITEISWSVMAAVAIFNALITLYSCLVTTWEFESLSRRIRTERTASENG